jgi:hypothetical protein
MPATAPGGHAGGSVVWDERGQRWQVRFYARSGAGTESRTFPLRDYGGNREHARVAAEAHRASRSLFDHLVQAGVVCAGQVVHQRRLQANDVLLEWNRVQPLEPPQDRCVGKEAATREHDRDAVICKFAQRRSKMPSLKPDPNQRAAAALLNSRKAFQLAMLHGAKV